MFLALLLVIFAVLHLPFFRKRARWNTLKERAAWALAASLIIAGALHFTFPGVFAGMIPEWLPARQELAYAGGGVLTLGGLGVIWKKVRRLASLGVTGMLAAFMPANIDVALHGLDLPGQQADLPAGHWLGWASVPMQLVYMFWSWKVAGGRRKRS